MHQFSYRLRERFLPNVFQFVTFTWCSIKACGMICSANWLTALSTSNLGYFPRQVNSYVTLFIKREKSTQYGQPLSRRKPSVIGKDCTVASVLVYYILVYYDDINTCMTCVGNIHSLTSLQGIFWHQLDFYWQHFRHWQTRTCSIVMKKILAESREELPTPTSTPLICIRFT